MIQVALRPQEINFNDHPDRRFHSVSIKKAYPFWRSKQGFYIHRVKYARWWPYGGRIHIDYWCGNGTNSPIAIDPETACACYKRCQRCEIAWEYRKHPHDL